MAAQNVATSEQVAVSIWRRDYRLSLVLVVVGVILVLAIAAFSFWAKSTGSYSTSFWTGLAIKVGGTAGGMLILLGGTVAYYHWRGLQLIEGTP